MLADVTTADHCFEITATGCTIEGLDIKQASETASAEGIRYNANGVLDIKCCIIWGDRGAVDQDGFYSGTVPSTSTVVNFENCVFYNFRRAGIHNYQAVGPTININSCTLGFCGEDGEAYSGELSIFGPGGPQTYANSFNSIFIGKIPAAYPDYHVQATYESYVTDAMDRCIYGTQERCDDIDDSQGGVSEYDTDQGSGSYVIFNDITGDMPWDLRLQDLANANNNAVAEHSDSAMGNEVNSQVLTMPATDLDGNTRSAPYCVGAFEIAAAGGGWTGKICGVTNPSKICGVDVANISKVCGV